MQSLQEERHEEEEEDRKKRRKKKMLKKGEEMQVDVELEWLKVARAELQVCVHPAWASDTRKGVQVTLNSLLFRYNEDLGGVVLAYLDLRFPSHVAKILPGLSPYFKVNLNANLLIFAPKMGMMLEGKVNKIEEDYVGVLVLGLFNAAIGVRDIRPDFRFAEESFERAWVSDSSRQHVIKFGTIIRFSVKSVQQRDEFLDIAGSLEPTDSGSVEWLSKEEASKARLERSEEKRSRKREKLEPTK